MEYCGWSICQSVGHIRGPCKNGLTNQDAILVGDSGGPKEPCVRSCADPRGGGNFGELTAHYKVMGHSTASCAKMAETRVGLRNRVLEGGRDRP